jgi:hypothetical protein
MSTTWAQLRTRIRQRTDNEYTDGEFVTDAELLGLANASQLQLFAMLVEAGLHSVPETIYSVPVDGSLNYDLPDTCYAVAGVFRLDNDQYVELERHNTHTMPRDTAQSIAVSYRTYGRLEDAVIEFNPRVSTGTYKVRYLSAPTDMSSDSDTVQGVVGWEEWIVLDVSIKVLHKEKLFEAADRLQSRLDKLTQKIEAQMFERDMHNTIQVHDVRGTTGNGLRDINGYLPGGYRGMWGWWGSL